MKLAQALAVGLTLALACLAGERFYQQRVTSDAQGHLTAWIAGSEPLFLPEFKGQEELFRAHCQPGVSKIEAVEEEWKFVAFRVWNSEQKAFLISTYKQAGEWRAQGHSIR